MARDIELEPSAARRAGRAQRVGLYKYIEVSKLSIANSPSGAIYPEVLGQICYLAIKADSQ